MTASNHIPCRCCMAETGTLQTTGEGTGVMHDTDSIQARYTKSRHRGSEDAPDTDTLPRSGARCALGLWDRPRLHARSNPLVARPDWRAQEAKLNAFPQFRVPLHGIDVHFIRAEGKGPDPMPLLLMHGWPGSVFEFMEIIPRLTDPARFGGDPADAFTVIAPSLPGYGLSFAPGQKRFSIHDIAACVADLMTEVLGFRRFAAQGGDWGGFTAACLGAL